MSMPLNELLKESRFTPDDSYDRYIRHLSLYATVRPDDLKNILNGNLSEFPGLQRKQEAKQGPLRQSLKDVFGSFSSKLNSIPFNLIREDEKSASTAHQDVEAQNGSKASKERELEDVRGTRYTITELQPHELSVIGFHIDKNICPGFKYRVRYADYTGTIFDGEARMLLTIGMGYGKRLTFRGDQVNHNDCYFWSDSYPNGFAFTLEAVSKGDKFVVLNDSCQPTGDATVESVDCPQTEESMTAQEGAVRKTVRVRFTCSVTYYHIHHHGLVDLSTHDLEQVEGLANVVKEKGSKEAVVQDIKGLFLSRIGNCYFRKGM